MASVTTRMDLTVPDDLESARAKLIYQYLAVTGGATADDVCETLHVDKGSVLSIVSTLRERGYVRNENGFYSV
ncbi:MULTISPECIES: helix-turn-helix domain-containing protein [Saliphagus]|uniref:Helix-turn-helix domain-containing protein n=1 Tax=Saliphagus infecundisoli TaxID=1849069 RepID=A0ABD5QK11_9EURY|nr:MULTISPECIES: helix-turn-helix domain-containing protein [Saliphagus]